MRAKHASSGPGRRAVLRWAWRLFRREWRQQLLVLALVTVAVAAAVAGSSVVVGAASHGRGEFGDAGALARVEAANPRAARAVVAAAKQRFGKIEVIGHASVRVPGSVAPLDVRSQDPDGIFGRPMLALRTGRYPTRAGEIALTEGALRLLSATVGDRIDLGRVKRVVVGRVENPGDLNDEFGLVPSGEYPSADSLTVLLASDARTGPVAAGPKRRSREIEFRLMIAGSDKAAVVASVLVATTLAMALVGLLAAAGFVVLAQRRQRQLGLLAAIGATERHLRLVMLANGAIVGVVAALGGGLLGVLGWIAAAPAVERAAAHRIDRLDLPWELIGACMLIAVVMAVIAAWWPARTMARLPVMAALSRRPARPLPVHRSLAAAVGLVALGMASIAAAHPTADHVRPLVLIAGILAVVIGVVLASPAAIRALGVPAGRLPFAPRLALRDLVRYQARAAAALAAITLALGISVAVVILAQSNEYRTDGGNLSQRELVIRVGDPRTAPNPYLSPAEQVRLDAAAKRIAAAVGDPTALALDVAMNPSIATDPNLREAISLAIPLGPDGFRGVGDAYVASPELLHHFGIDPATIHDTTDLLTTRPGDPLLLDVATRPDPQHLRTPLQRVDLPSYTSEPNSLITPSGMRRHGWVRARAGWLAESVKPLTDQQIATARTRAAAAGLTIETRSAQDDLAALRTGATTVGSVLALAIVAMTIGLIRSEATADLRTLTATGATASTRRTLTASTAGALALLGVILSTAGAYIALVAAYHADLGRLVPLPITNLLLLALGLPSIAMAGGWLLAGREPKTFSRQAVD